MITEMNSSHSVYFTSDPTTFIEMRTKYYGKFNQIWKGKLI
jgi:hypothetical protein